MAGPASSGAFYDFRSDTPESTRAKRKMIDAMLEQATTYRPTPHWLGAVAQGLQGLAGGDLIHDLQEQEKADKAAGKAPVTKMFGLDTPAASPDAAGGGAEVPMSPPPVAPALTPPAPRAPMPPPAARAYAPPDQGGAPGDVVGYDYAGPTV